MNHVTHLGGGGSAKGWCYTISLFIKKGDKGEGGAKNLKKWVTSFMDGHLVIRNVKLKIKKENKWFFAKGQNMHSLYLLMLCIFLKSFHSHLSSALDFGVQKYCNFCQLNRQITSRNIIIWLVFFCTMGFFYFKNVQKFVLKL